MNAREIISSFEMTDPHKAVDLLQAILQIAEIINNSRLNYNKRIDLVLKIILDYMEVEQGSIMVLERRKLVVRAASRPELIGLCQPITEESVAGWVACNGTPLFIADISRDGRFKRRDDYNYKKNSLLSVPVLHGKKVIGVFNITDKAGSTDLLKEDIRYLLQFGSTILWSLEQQKLHDKLKKQRATLRKRNRELRRQEELRAQLSRLLIHDLKAPLSEVVANLDILSYTVSAENREFLEGAQMGCDRAVRMVSNLVAIDKIEADRMILLREEVNPQELLRESLSGVTGMARMKKVELIDESRETELINVDRTMILRVLQNLLMNALANSMSGKIIRVGCSPVPGKRKIEFYVKDQGEGIPADKQEMIFDKYARVSGRQDSLVGSGLGLYFCKLAIKQHRGTISVSSSPGQGSCFNFILPPGR
jgi:two-component system sensor histidine kinase KdpD